MKLVHVAAAAILHRDMVLLSQRLEHTHQGGKWEFPGGKKEPGESIEQALQRELEEELAIRAELFRPLIRVRHDYPEFTVLLDVWRVDAFSGTPQGREGQQVRWYALDSLDGLTFPPANLPVIRALRAAQQIVISPASAALDKAFMAQCARWLQRPVYLQFNSPQLALVDYLEWLQILQRLDTHPHAAVMASHPDLLPFEGPESASFWPFRQIDQKHLDANALLQAKTGGHRRGALCKTLSDLADAGSAALDFLIFAPANNETDWVLFRNLADALTVPVYIMHLDIEGQEQQAWALGAQGFVNQKGFWTE